MDASNSFGLLLQTEISAVLAGKVSLLNPHGKKFTPDEIHRALNAARHTLATALGDDAFNLFTDHRL